MKLTISYAPPAADVAYQIEAALHSAGLYAEAVEDNTLTLDRPVRVVVDEVTPDIDYAIAIAQVAIDRYKAAGAAQP